jgi:hypothetical protein
MTPLTLVISVVVQDISLQAEAVATQGAWRLGMKLPSNVQHEANL